MIILEFLDDFRDLELELWTHESGSWFIDGYNRGQPSNYIEPEKLHFLRSQLRDMSLRLIGQKLIVQNN